MIYKEIYVICAGRYVAYEPSDEYIKFACTDKAEAKKSLSKVMDTILKGEDPNFSYIRCKTLPPILRAPDGGRLVAEFVNSTPISVWYDTVRLFEKEIPEDAYGARDLP